MIDLALLETKQTKKNRYITGKSKNPFDQRKEGDEHNRNIPKMSSRELQVSKNPIKI